MSAVGNPNDYVQCPYDKGHHILRSRFPIHLQKCRKNHPNVQKAVCPFNTTHLLNEPELEWHVQTCPQRASFERFRMAEANHRVPENEPSQMPVESGESWDDCDAPTYDAKAASLNSNVLRSIQGATRSERKRFREEERRRLLALNK